MDAKKHIRLPHSAITKSTGLLPMMYSISELCEELDVPRHRILSWLQNGLDHHRDERNRIWIKGYDCKSWIRKIRESQKKANTLRANQAYCFRCRQSVDITDPQEVIENGNARLTGTCPHCQGKLNKGVKRGQPKKLQTNPGISSVQKRNQPTQPGIAPQV